MGKRKALPATTPAAFTVADALEHGLTVAQLRGAQFARPFRGVRSVSPPDSLQARCAALATRVPGHVFFAGATAARLHGMPLPAGHDERLVLGVAAPARAVAPREMIGRSLTIDSDDICSQGRLRVTSAVRTWCDLAAGLDLPDLVAAADFLVHARRVTRGDLESAVAKYPSRRGIARLREALPLVDGRAESHPESIVRIALTLAGIAPTAVNREVRDASGRFVARPDLSYPEHLIAIEYLGDYHRVEKGRWRKDRARVTRMRALGWLVIELTGDDLADLPGVVAQVMAALAAR
ncbi:hypothetical protein HQQ80_16020 [Microbacteriaceae bacterium VKM Ac-2855]|nr:hypothetical protein [Microbacteriaceae bacterium VKM Ac-2855]